VSKRRSAHKTPKTDAQIDRRIASWPFRVTRRSRSMLFGPPSIHGGPVRIGGGPTSIRGGPVHIGGGPTSIRGGPVHIGGGPTSIRGGPERGSSRRSRLSSLLIT
jgi:hypothetical protein